MARSMFRPRGAFGRVAPNQGNRRFIAGGQGTLGWPTFIGPNIADINATAGVAITPIDCKPRFANDLGPAVVWSQVGAWPAWLTLDPVTGVISGATPVSAANATGIQVQCQRGTFKPALSNAFNVTVP